MFYAVFWLALLIAKARADGYGYGGGSWGDWSSSSSSATVAATASPAAAAAASSTSQSGELVIQVVSVSDSSGSLSYFPDNVQAAPGSVVQFQFHPKNHTITESSFAAPCKPLADNLTSPTRPGLRSGFVPVTGMESTMPVYNVLINDTKPIWIYCGQTNHCQKGMVMVINQNMSSTDKTIENYKLMAMQMPLAGAGGSSATMSYGAGPSSAAVVSAPSVAPTSDSLSSPTSVAGQSASATATSPTVFTGAANRHEILGVPALTGLLFGGIVAVWQS